MTRAGLKIGDIDIAGRVLIAPMTGVSDLPFRHMAAKLGAPYAATEMVACEDLFKQRPDVVRKAELGAHDGNVLRRRRFERRPRHGPTVGLSSVSACSVVVPAVRMLPSSARTQSTFVVWMLSLIGAPSSVVTVVPSSMTR